MLYNIESVLNKGLTMIRFFKILLLLSVCMFANDKSITINNTKIGVSIKSYDLGYQGFKIVKSKDNLTAFITHAQGFDIYDISNPINITKLSSFSSPTSSLDSKSINNILLTSDESKAYLLTNKMVKILDISNLSNPTLISSFAPNNNPNTTNPQSITLSLDETKAYVAYFETVFEVYDVSDVANPTYISKHVLNDSNELVKSNDGTKLYFATEFNEENEYFRQYLEPNGLLLLLDCIWGGTDRK